MRVAAQSLRVAAQSLRVAAQSLRFVAQSPSQYPLVSNKPLLLLLGLPRRGGRLRRLQSRRLRRLTSSVSEAETGATTVSDAETGATRKVSCMRARSLAWR